MNADSAGWPPTLRPNQPIWAVSPPKDWLLPSADTITIYYYYSARKLILILPSHRCGVSVILASWQPLVRALAPMVVPVWPAGSRLPPSVRPWITVLSLYCLVLRVNGLPILVTCYTNAEQSLFGHPWWECRVLEGWPPDRWAADRLVASSAATGTCCLVGRLASATTKWDGLVLWAW